MKTFGNHSETTLEVQNKIFSKHHSVQLNLYFKNDCKSQMM